MSLSPDQFQYLIEDNPGNAMMYVRAYAGKQVGELAVKARDYPRRGHRGPFPRAKQPQIRGAFVHPDYQRHGVGTEMYDIAAHHLGQAPMHDASVTKEAQGWAAKVGGALDPGMHTGDTLDPEDLRQQFSASPTYAQSLRAGGMRPKPRQLAFKGM